MNSSVTEEPIELNLDDILERENTHNKTESWNKLNKTSKIQKLHQYSEKHGKEHKYSAKEINQLKRFFSDMLYKKKLQKTKEVVYNKITQEITDVPGLFLHPSSRTFTLKADKTRQSTLKSLGPTKRDISDRKKPTVHVIEDDSSEKL